MSASETLHQLQASLVERLVTDERARIALDAPGGTGKTRAITGAIDRIVRNDPLSTWVLIVAPASIGSYIGSQLKELAGPMRVHRLQGTDLRLLEKENALLEPGVYSVSSELTRQPWVREVLSSLSWSLVCIDEAHHGGSATSDLIAQLGQSERTQRLLAASATWNQHPPGLDVVTWDLAPARSAARRVEIVYYERCQEERQVRERLTQIEEKFGAGSAIRATLDRAWRSSASAFEFVLARQATALQPPQPEMKPVGEPTLRKRTKMPLRVRASETALQPSQLEMKPVTDPILRRRERTGHKASEIAWSDPGGAARALEDLLQEAGTIGRDSKLEAFLAHVRGRGQSSKILVFTEMRQTALYLAAALGNEDVLTAVIDGTRPTVDRTLSAKTRVAVVTDAVLPAVDFSSTFEGVSYDLPANPDRLNARWSVLTASTSEAVMSILVDASNTDEVELRLARKDEIIRSALGDHGPSRH